MIDYDPNPLAMKSGDINKCGWFNQPCALEEECYQIFLSGSALYHPQCPIFVIDRLHVKLNELLEELWTN